MSVYVFAGPTLAAADIYRVLPEAICLPPAACGDLYRVAQRRPRAIAIIDGYFERMPSVWHKEILWAMASSIHVFGSSSMGALRAAELHTFGMTGVGRVFELLSSGELEDDDEVAIIHGAADSGYRALSDAMVDIRATLAAARAGGVICFDCQDKLVRIAKGLHYRDRSYPNLLRLAAGATHSDELGTFASWLPSGRVSQKRLDALELLGLLKEWLNDGLPSKQVEYTLATTEVWRQLTDNPAEGVGSTGARLGGSDGVLDELRLNPLRYLAVRTAVLARLFGTVFAEQHGVRPDAAALTATAERFRRARALEAESALEEWLDRNDMGSADFLRLCRDETLLDWAALASSSMLSGYLRDHVRVTGEYVELAARAADKASVLGEVGTDRQSLQELGITEEDLMCWFVREHLRLDANLSLDAYTELVGYATTTDSVRALVREYRYAKESGHEPLR